MNKENDTIDIREFKREALKRKVKEKLDWCKDRVEAGVEYIEEHKELLIPIGVALAGGMKRVISSRAKAKEEEEFACKYYDPRTGKTEYARKKPSVKQRLEIERRYQEGESYLDILHDMRLLK